MTNDANRDGRDDEAVGGPGGEANAEERAARARRLAEIARPTARDRAKAWQSNIDRAIAEAAERGAFDDLPGKGKPLAFDTDVDDDMWLANHLLKGQGFRPAWIERLRDVNAARAALAERIDRFAADWASPGADPAWANARAAAIARLEAELRDRVTALNRLIDAHNLDEAGDRLPQRRVAVEDLLADLRARGFSA